MNIYPVVVNGYPYLWNEKDQVLIQPDLSAHVHRLHITRQELEQISDCIKYDEKRQHVERVFKTQFPKIDFKTLKHL